MKQTRMMLGGIVLGMLAGLALVGVVILGLGPTSAAPPTAATLNVAGAPTAPAASDSGAAGTPGAASDVRQHYTDLLVQNFASRLGVDQARLNSAFVAAANDTIDQAVHDGKLDATAAAKAKALAGQGLAAVLPDAFGSTSRVAGDKPASSPVQEAAVQAILPAVAGRLGLTPDQLGAAIKNGQTLTALEQAHNVTHQQVKDAVLAAVHNALTAGAQRGTWSQGDVDRVYQEVSANLDGYLMKIMNAGAPDAKGPPGADAGPEPVALDTINTTIAAQVGMSFSDFENALRNGQTLTQLEQARHLTEQQLHDTALVAARGALDKGVTAGTWTKADADASYQSISTNFYQYLVKIRQGVPVSAAYDAATAALAALLGMTDNQLHDTVKGGQSLAGLEQAHNVSAQQAHDAALAAGQKAIVDGVGAGKWTQAQADDAKVAFAETVDTFLGTMDRAPSAAGTPTK